MSHDASGGPATGDRSTVTTSGSTTPADSIAIAAASFDDGSGAFSLADSLSSETGLSLATLFVVVDALVDADFSVLSVFSVFVVVADGLALPVVFGAVVLLGVLALSRVLLDPEVPRSFATGAVTFVESTIGWGAVVDRTPGAHAPAMTIAISGIRV